jgi:hypothetical protein
VLALSPVSYYGDKLTATYSFFNLNITDTISDKLLIDFFKLSARSNPDFVVSLTSSLKAFAKYLNDDDMKALDQLDVMTFEETLSRLEIDYKVVDPNIIYTAYTTKVVLDGSEDKKITSRTLFVIAKHLRSDLLLEKYYETFVDYLSPMSLERACEQLDGNLNTA